VRIVSASELMNQARHRSALQQPQPDCCATVLRLLAASSPNWPEIALVTARDPALCMLLLSAAPLRPRELDDGLNSVLRHRLETLGADLLRAWLLSMPCSPTHQGNALLLAECALHLALETHYPRPDEAYLAGLWFNLSTDPGGEACQEPAARISLQADNPRQMLARLVSDCGLPATLSDALELGTLLDEQIEQAHPLVRLLHAARQLSTDGWEQHVSRLAPLTGLPASSLTSLRTDVGYIVAGHAAYPPPPQRASGAMTLFGSPDKVIAPDNEPIIAAALHGLIVAGFSDVDAEQAIRRLAIACPLLSGEALPIVLHPDDDGVLQPLLGAAETEAVRGLGELRLRVEDEASQVALAQRSGVHTSYFPATRTPGRSMADWHLQRWLGRRGFSCIPLQLGPVTGVAVVALEHEHSLGISERWQLGELLSAAGRVLLTLRRQDHAIAAREQELHARFREHVRRIAHEATNPLTVIKNRLSLIGQDHANDGSLQEDMSLLNAELDRIGNLLRQAGNLPVAERELASCNVVELMQEMRALYGESLFTQRGIQLELRAASGTPPVAMPPSALKQVLLNLMRNAAEALQPGGRLLLALAGQVVVDGHACAELRLVDNGPGLPPERTSNLFAPRPSAKGGNHQGIGLSVVHDILTQWKSSILCRSQSGSGTTFQIFIPLDHSR